MPSLYLRADSESSCIIRYSSQTLALEIVAYRDIQPGEEVTLSCECFLWTLTLPLQFSPEQTSR